MQLLWHCVVGSLLHTSPQAYYETPKRSPGGLPEELGMGAAAIPAGVLEVQAPPPASTITIKKTTVQVGAWLRVQIIKCALWLVIVVPRLISPYIIRELE